MNYQNINLIDLLTEETKNKISDLIRTDFNSFLHECPDSKIELNNFILAMIDELIKEKADSCTDKIINDTLSETDINLRLIEILHQERRARSLLEADNTAALRSEVCFLNKEVELLKKRLYEYKYIDAKYIETLKYMGLY